MEIKKLVLICLDLVLANNHHVEVSRPDCHNFEFWYLEIKTENEFEKSISSGFVVGANNVMRFVMC